MSALVGIVAHGPASIFPPIQRRSRRGRGVTGAISAGSSPKSARPLLSRREASLVPVIVVAVTVNITSSALAGGEKVRGENGQGAVHQVQVQDPPPFQP